MHRHVNFPSFTSSFSIQSCLNIADRGHNKQTHNPVYIVTTSSCSTKFFLKVHLCILQLYKRKRNSDNDTSVLSLPWSRFCKLKRVETGFDLDSVRATRRQVGIFEKLEEALVVQLNWRLVKNCCLWIRFMGDVKEATQLLVLLTQTQCGIPIDGIRSFTLAPNEKSKTLYISCACTWKRISCACTWKREWRLISTSGLGLIQSGPKLLLTRSIKFIDPLQFFSTCYDFISLFLVSDFILLLDEVGQKHSKYIQRLYSKKSECKINNNYIIIIIKDSSTTNSTLRFTLPVWFLRSIAHRVFFFMLCTCGN